MNRPRPLSLLHALRPAVATTVLLLAVATPASAQRCPLPAAVFEDFPFEGAIAHVRYLADDDLGGRAVATAGERCAAFYVAEAFRAAGLEPGGRRGTYFHGFPVRTGTALGADQTLRFGASTLTVGTDWTPMGVSASTRTEAPLAYADYGISQPSVDAPSSAVDLTGRVAVVEWGDPGSPDDTSLWSDPAFKARVAAGRGAAGLLVLLPNGAPLPDVTREAGDALDIPVAVVSHAVAEVVRAAARRGEPVLLATDVRPVASEARNVVGVLPGAVPDAGYVIVGAHFDHLGMGEDGDARRVYNGADDNASGTAALIEVAWRLRSAALDRTVVFIAFTGEERGLWGSARFVEDPTVDLSEALAMVNLDMVGRLEDGPLEVHGTGTAGEWERLVADANAGLPNPIPLETVAAGSGPSDHATFNALGMPVLHFFTGAHEDYHRPTDDWEKVDVDGMERVIGLAAEVVRRLANTDRTPSLTPTGAPPR